MRKLLFCAVLLVTPISMLVTPTPTWAQTNTGVIAGTVTDQSGAVIPNAKVTITSQSTNAPLTFTTNADGYFTSVPINPDTYSVAVTAQGFQAQEQSGIILRVQDRLNLNFKLTVGSVNNRVVVTGQTPVVDTQTSSLGQVVSSETIESMPLNGRNYLQLAGLSAGVVQTNGVSATDGLSGGSTGPNAVDFASNGSRGTLNNYLLDGVDNNSNDTGGIVITTQPDALQEFKIQTSSYSAQFGRSGGAVVNAVTKSGTNNYHGDVFWFFRNSWLDARNFFNTPANGPKQPFKQDQWGGTIGGPIKKDKLFWFGDYQATTIRNYSTRFATVPTAAEKTGDFSADTNLIYDPTTQHVAGDGTVTRTSFLAETGKNAIPSDLIDPISQAFVNLYPAATIPNVTRNNYVANINSPYDLMQGDFRGDWDPSQKDQAFFRFSDAGFTRLSSQIFPGIAQGQSGSVQGESIMGASLGETHIFSPTVFNEFRLGFSWYSDGQEIPPFGIHFPPPELTIPGIPLFANTAGVAAFSPSGYRGVGMGGYDPTYLATVEDQVSDAISFIRGKHSMSAGFEMRWSQFNIFQVPNPDGSLQFTGQFTTANATSKSLANGLADALLGYPVDATYDTQVEVQNRQRVPSVFFQDDWRVTPTLTLNLGLRYDYFPPIVGKHNVQANFDYSVPSTALPPTGLLQAGVNGNSRGLVKVDKMNFAPRIGFAKTMGKTVVSAGGGIFWSGQEIKTAGPLQLAYNLPFYYQPDFRSDGITPKIKISAGFPAANINQAINPGVTSLGGSPTNTQNFLSTPSYVEYNFSIQRALPGQMSLELSYAGAKGTHLQSVVDYNQDKVPGPTDPQLRRPYPNYGSFTSIVNRGNSDYESGQVKFEKHAGNGLYFLSSFTWGKAYDDQAEICCAGPPPNTWNLPSEMGLADFNETLRWVFSYDYLLPFGQGQRYLGGASSAVNQIIGGWHFGGIYTLGSGFPFSPSLGYDSSNTNTQGGVRPNQVLPDANLPRSKRSINEWFNAENAYSDAGIETAPDGTPILDADGNPITVYAFGDAGRNTLIGPDTNNFDLSLRKTFPIRESKNVEFRFEAFNALNHPSFAQPDNTFTDGPPSQGGTFGVVTGTAGANRDLQLALKFNF